MVTLKIDNDEETIDDQVTYLNAIIDRLEHGFTSGTNWKTEGEEEVEEDEEDDDDEDSDEEETE